jgi:hypothetical protein
LEEGAVEVAAAAVAAAAIGAISVGVPCRGACRGAIALIRIRKAGEDIRGGTAAAA